MASAGEHNPDVPSARWWRRHIRRIKREADKQKLFDQNIEKITKHYRRELEQEFDWPGWGKKSSWTVEEAVTLVFGIDLFAEMEANQLCYGDSKWPCRSEVEELVDRAYRDHAAGKLALKEVNGTHFVSPKDFLQWAKDHDVDIPADLLFQVLDEVSPGKLEKGTPAERKHRERGVQACLILIKNGERKLTYARICEVINTDPKFRRTRSRNVKSATLIKAFSTVGDPRQDKRVIAAVEKQKNAKK